MEAELRAPLATARLVRVVKPSASIGALPKENALRLDLCLTQRAAGASACYGNHWRRDRYERIGDIFLVPSGEVVYGRGEAGEALSVVQLLQPQALAEWFEDSLQWTPSKLEDCLNIRSGPIRALLLRLAQEISHPGFASEAMGELIAEQVAIELARHCRSLPERRSRGGLAPWRLRLIDERLSEDPTPASLAELAALCRISPRQLTRGFRTSRSCSIGEYMADNRIAHAKRLLASNNCIKEIAHVTGFKSHSSFSHAFREATSETPRQYCQRVQSVRNAGPGVGKVCI